MLKRLLAKAITAFSIQPAFRGASATPQQVEIPGPNEEDEIVREMDIQCIATVRNDGSRFTGPRMAWQQQAQIQAGRRLANACLAGTEATERFIAERTR